MNDEKNPQANDIIFYTTPDGQVNIKVLLLGENFWLSQKKMSELFGVELNTNNCYLKEIFKTR